MSERELRFAAEPCARSVPTRGLVLLIEPSAPVRASLGRYLARHFGAVVTAADAGEVGAVLGGLLPTHLVCAGSVARRALEWRARWGLERLVVLSGAVDPVEAVPGVDAVLLKPVDPGCLLRCLLHPTPGFGALIEGG